MNKFLFYKWKPKVVLSIALIIILRLILTDYINIKRAASICPACIGYPVILRVCECGSTLPDFLGEIILLAIVPFVISYLALSVIMRRKK